MWKHSQRNEKDMRRTPDHPIVPRTAKIQLVLDPMFS